MTTPHPLSYEVRQTLGRIGYHAYGEIVGGITHDGRPLPEWEELGDKIRAAWVHQAATVHGTRIVAGHPNGGPDLTGEPWLPDRQERIMGPNASMGETDG